MWYKQPLMIGLLILFSAVTLQGQSDKNSRINSILSQWYGPNSPSVGVLIIHEDEVKVKKCYGFANIGEAQPANPLTNYDLGSLTEQFTVMAAMILMEEDRLKQKQPLLEIWPGLPDYFKGIKVKHLLAHTSGLPYLRRMKLYGEVTSFKDLKKFFHNKDKLSNQPGQMARQNPANTALLASLIEKRTNDSYRKFVKKRIFTPLGMENSRVYKKGWFREIPSKAISYFPQNDTLYKDAGDFPENYIEGAIGVYSNLDDLVKWFKAWKTDTLVPRNRLNKVEQINYIRGQKNFPGYGWVKAFNKGNKYLYRGGFGRGTSHILLRVPSEDISVAIVSNQSTLFGLRRRAFELVNLYSERQYSTD